MKTWHLLGAIVGLLAVAVAIQVQRDRGWEPYEPATPVMWLKAGPAIQRASLGYDALVADVYWMRAVVYFGQQRLSTAANKNYDLLHPLLDLVTTLDPHFSVAYRFGAIFLSEPAPGGPFRPDLAVALLERAMQHNPTRWEYPHDIGFVYYFAYQDYVAASQWFDRASKVPGAPIWLRTTAGVTLARGGERDASRMLWRELYDNAEADAIRESALVRLAQLDALDQIDRLNEIVWRYEARTGRFPGSWRELIAAGVLAREPHDPTGEAYVLDAENEDVRIAKRSKLWSVPQGMEDYRQ